MSLLYQTVLIIRDQFIGGVKTLSFLKFGLIFMDEDVILNFQLLKSDSTLEFSVDS